MTENPYEILEVPKNASQDEIKKAFRNKAMKYHPDKQPENKKAEAEKMFCKINNAYDILSDEKKRKMYDMTGSCDGNGAGMNSDIFENIFSNIFGGMSGMHGMHGMHGMNNNMKNKKRIYESQLQITLTELMYGCEKTIKTNVTINCTKCESNNVKCSSCNGRGVSVQSMGPGLMIQTMCNSCFGNGYTNKNKSSCVMCKGKSEVALDKEFKFKVPPSFPNKAKIQLESTDSHEINVVIVYKLEDNVTVEGRDVHIKLAPLSLKELLCGFNRKIDLYGKSINLKSSGYFNPNKSKKLDGRGLPYVNNNNKFGDLYIHYSIEYKDDPELAEKSDEFKGIFTNE
jgi:DnaJ-class molecular chaperone